MGPRPVSGVGVLVAFLHLGCPKPAPPPVVATPSVQAPKLHHRARNAYVTAHLHRAQGELEQAAESYQRALVFDPNSPVLVQELGELRAEQGKHEAAVALLERAIELGAGDSARLSLCESVVTSGVGQVDLADWTPPPQSAWMWARCAHLALPNADPEPALEAVAQSLALTPQNAEAWDTAAALVHAHQRYATGLAWVEQALQEDPWDRGLLRRKAGLSVDPAGLERDLGAWISALKQLDALGEPVLKELALATSRARGQASLLPRLEEPALSLQRLALGESAPLCEGSASLSCGLKARCMVSKGQVQGGAQAMAFCEDEDPQRRVEQAMAWHPALWVELRGELTGPAMHRAGVRFALAQGDPQAALAQLHGLPESDPFHPGLLGQAQLALGQDARQALREGHERLPGEPVLMAALAQAHYQQGDAEKGALWAAKAAALGTRTTPPASESP